MRIGSLQFSEADEKYVSAALGRTPRGVVGVAARNDDRTPAVIINMPLVRVDNDWQPFPTLYWLVDPALCAAISDIERQGAIGELEAALAEDDNLLHAHLADNKLYARSRWAVLNDAEKQAAEQQGFRETLETTGIAGVANPAGLKCLHAQYAYHLARYETGTTVGKLMKKRYGIGKS